MQHGFLDRYAGLDSPLHILDARAKILAFFALVLTAVSTPPEAGRCFLGYFLLLVVLLAVSRVPPRFFLRRMLLVVPFVLVAAAFVPFMPPSGSGDGFALSRAGLITFWGILAKALIGAASMILLASTTAFPRLLAGLGRLKCPPLLIQLAGFAYRYLFVLVDEAGRLKRARDARCYGGRWLWQAGVVGRLVGTLFLRSYERSERIYLAMAARGFTGRPPTWEKHPWRARDALFLLLFATALVGLRGRLT